MAKKSTNANKFKKVLHDFDNSNNKCRKGGMPFYHASVTKCQTKRFIFSGKTSIINILGFIF